MTIFFFEYSEDKEPYLVKTDETILQEIIYELFGNAIRFRTTGTAIIITIKKREDIVHMEIENVIPVKDVEKTKGYLQKIDAFWNWQNVSSAGDIQLGLVFTKGYAEMVNIDINYSVEKN